MMRFKIDENLHDDVADALRTHGHDALTVFEEGLRGAPIRKLPRPPVAKGASW